MQHCLKFFGKKKKRKKGLDVDGGRADILFCVEAEQQDIQARVGRRD